MTKSTVHTTQDKDSLQETGAATQAAFPELFKTKEPITVKPLSLETAGSELYAAIMNGEMNNVRGQLLHGESKVSEAEAVLFIHAREKAREKSASRRKKDEDCAIHKRAKRKKDKETDYVPARRSGSTVKTSSKSSSGTGSVKSSYFYADRFGGRYDGAGYETADGSYRTTAGEFYNAADNVVTLTNGTAYAMSADLRNDAAEIMRTAHLVRSVRISTPKSELKFARTTQSLPTEASVAAVAADAAAIQTADIESRAAAVARTESFDSEAHKAPAAALGELEGMPGFSEEDLHMAIQLYHKARREKRRIYEVLNESDCRDILDVRDGLACVDKSSARSITCHRGGYSTISASFNPASNEPIVITALNEVGRSIKGSFRKASNGDKPKAPAPAKHEMAVA